MLSIEKYASTGKTNLKLLNTDLTQKSIKNALYNRIASNIEYRICHVK